jgi:hypothetical protein
VRDECGVRGGCDVWRGMGPGAARGGCDVRGGGRVLAVGFGGLVGGGFC